MVGIVHDVLWSYFSSYVLLRPELEAVIRGLVGTERGDTEKVTISNVLT